MDTCLGHVKQVGLVDVLREEYGIMPAGMLGHSAGEIACGYADGALTREQTVRFRGIPNAKSEHFPALKKQHRVLREGCISIEL